MLGFAAVSPSGDVLSIEGASGEDLAASLPLVVGLAGKFGEALNWKAPEAIAISSRDESFYMSRRKDHFAGVLLSHALTMRGLINQLDEP